MTPSVARIKLAVVEAVGRNGGKDSAALTADRQPSTAGRWQNPNDDVFPPVECAFKLDQVSMMLGDNPHILFQLAAELGHVCLRVPDVQIGSADLNSALIDACAEFGDISDEVRKATSDHKVCARDSNRIIVQIDEAMQSLARLRAVVNVLPDEG